MNFVLRHRRAAFSLVEVVLALGVVSFAIVSLVGLLALGLTTGQQSAEDVRTANLASAILAQRRALPLAESGPAKDFPLPKLDVSVPGTSIFLTADGLPTTVDAQKYYRLNYSVTANPTSSVSRVYLSLSTPWQVTTPGQMTARYELATSIRVN
jgi:uncharacterized protein (TIGR02598 family)